MKIEIKCRFSGKVLFEHEAEENNIRITLEAAVTASANLSGANLSRANLYGADLYGANLSGANLSGANLSGANLYGADLSRANLSRANLSRANLYGADLYGANLEGEVLTKAPSSLVNLRWDILITGQFMRIGCQRHTHKQWSQFSDEEINDMAVGALEFWRKWKTALMALCEQHHEDPDTEKSQEKEAA